MIKAALALASLVFGFGFAQLALADGPTRTPWQQNDGSAPIYGLTCLQYLGDPCAYQYSSIPSVDDSDWFPAPDPDTINFGHGNASQLVGGSCGTAADFTYFQTLVAVPAGTVVTDFTIAFSGMDDGSQVSICNADHPGCDVVPGSHVVLGGTGTTDLSALLIEGSNRIVITQMDNCPVGNTLRSAIVILNGESVDVPPPDADGDGVLDTDDSCPVTNLESTVSILGMDSGVENLVSSQGCSVSDLVTQIIDDCNQSSNHGRFVSCTARGLNDLLSAGIITDEEKDALQSTAAQSDVGKPQQASGKAGKGK